MARVKRRRSTSNSSASAKTTGSSSKSNSNSNSKASSKGTSDTTAAEAIVDRLLEWVNRQSESQERETLSSNKRTTSSSTIHPFQAMLHALATDQVLLSSDVTTSTKSSSSSYQWDAYYWILATRLLTRLIQSLSLKDDDDHDDDSSEEYLQAQLLMLTVLVDCMGTLVSRQIPAHTQQASPYLSRGICAVTAACLQGLEVISQQLKVQDNSTTTASVPHFYTEVVRTLTHTLSLWNENVKPPTISEPTTELPIPLVAWKDRRQQISEACHALDAYPELEDCLEQLAKVETLPTAVATPSPPSSKRTSRSSKRKTNSPSPSNSQYTKLVKSLKAALGEDLEISSKRESRNSTRDHVATIIVGYNQGQVLLLQTLESLDQLPLMTCWERSYWAMTLVQIVHTAATNAGLEPPLGHAGRFLTSLANNINPNTNTKRKSSSTRPDLAIPAARAIQSIMGLHSQCLAQVPDYSIVNNEEETDATQFQDSDGDEAMDHENDTSLLSESGIKVNFSLVEILPLLCSLASVTSASGISRTATKQSKSLLRGYVSALILQQLSNPEYPLDCRLANLALELIAELIHATKDRDSDVDEDKSAKSLDELEDLYNLSQPLDVTDVMEAFGAHMGKDEFQDFLLSLILRSLSIRAMNAEEDILSFFLSSILDVTRRILDVRTKSHVAIESEVSKSSKSRKRSKTSSRKTKRRKVEDKEPVEVFSEEAAELQRISDYRASATIYALRILRHSLSRQDKDLCEILPTLRTRLTVAHIQQFLSVGALLDSAILKTRSGPSRILPKWEDGTSDQEDMADDDFDDPEDAHHENKIRGLEYEVWLELMQTIPLFTPTRSHPFSDSDLYHLVTSLKRDGEPWPLALPRPHVAFLHTLLAHGGPTRSKTSVDEFLAAQYTASVRDKLSHLESIPTVLRTKNALYLDGHISLSIYNARTFLLAFSMQSDEDRKKIVYTIRSALNEAGASMLENRDELLRFAANPDASGFVARVIVLLTTMISFVSPHRQLKQELFSACSKLDVWMLPLFQRWDEWCSPERSYVGLFHDWESPLSPLAESNRNDFFGVREKQANEMRGVLEIFFAIGFETAQQDICHLLFAAWNTLGKLRKETPQKLRSSDSPSLQILAEAPHYPRRILQMREDICLIHGELKARSSGNRTLSPLKFRSNLKSMLHRANLLLGHLLKKVAQDGEEEDMMQPRSYFSLLSSTATFAASIVAAHTTEGDNYFTRAFTGNSVKKNTGQRSDDALTSDLESVDTDDAETNTAAEARTRLRDCCDAFGGAPIHPDWLDRSCSFQDGVRSSDAVENAETAISMLNRLISIAMHQYKLSLARLIRVYSVRNMKEDAWQLLTELVSLASNADKDLSITDSIACLAGVDKNFIRFIPGGLMKNDTTHQKTETAKDSWCPRAAHRVIGQLHDAENTLNGSEMATVALRASGEWELLLSENLIVACLDGRQLDLSWPEAGGDEFAKFRAIEAVHLWHGILVNATSSILPATSLLRMGLCKSGRQAHPSSSQNYHQDPYDLIPLKFSEKTVAEGGLTPLVQVTTQKAINLMARISAEWGGTLTDMSHSVAAQLFDNSESFDTLCVVHLISTLTVTLYECVKLQKDFWNATDQRDAFGYILKMLCRSIKTHGHKTAISQSDVQVDTHVLWNLLVGSGFKAVGTIVGNEQDIFSLFQKSSKHRMFSAREQGWSKPKAQAMAVTALLSILTGGGLLKAQDEAAFLINTLLRSGVVSSGEETRNWDVLGDVIRHFNKATPVATAKLISDCICTFEADASTRGRDNMSEFFQHLIRQRHTGEKFKHAKPVFEKLVSSFGQWPSSCERSILQPYSETLILYAHFFDKLREVAEMAIGNWNSQKGSGSEWSVFAFALLRFVKEMKHVPLQLRSGLKAEVPGETPSPVPKWCLLDPPLPSTCSFVEKSGYHGQHWYNCYTCGLVWEKGCCTVCATVCHEGHDVSYSRYSSFFCDCGAEANGTEAQQTCKCLTRLPENKVRSTFGRTSDSQKVGQTHQSLSTADRVWLIIGQQMSTPDKKAQIRAFSNELDLQAWSQAILAVLADQFNQWRKQRIKTFQNPSTANEFAKAFQLGGHRISAFNLACALRVCPERDRALGGFSTQPLLPIRAVKGMKKGLSVDHPAATKLLARFGSPTRVTRSMLDADSRGRVVIADESSLTFASSIPACAARYEQHATEVPLDRHQTSIMQSLPLDFCIHGLRICSENDRQILVWGMRKAAILLMHPRWIATECQLSISVNSDENGGDFIVKCEWLPASDVFIMVASRRSIKIYDIRKANVDKVIEETATYGVGLTSTIRDFTSVQVETKDPYLDGQSSDLVIRSFCLLENGKLKLVDCKANCAGDISLHLVREVENFSTATIDSTKGWTEDPTDPSATSTFSRTPGEGFAVTYLRQSRILLYSSTSSGVIALMIAKNGEVSNSFQLLPREIRSELLGQKQGDEAIVGPFQHWVELGIAYHEKESFFRVACIGRSKKTDQPRIICVQYNNNAISVGEISWLDGSIEGLELNSSCDGLCSFSLPFMGDRYREFRSWGERGFLCATTSSGSMLFFGENEVATVGSIDGNNRSFRQTSLVSFAPPSCIDTARPEFPVTIFEKLKNVSDCKDIFYFGEATGFDPEDLKSRLSRDSSAAFICRNPHGCCIGIGLSDSGSAETKAEKHPSTDGEIVIVAVRVLVGSSAKGIPRYISVQGRSIELAPRMKKWYSVPLTEEEILFGVRSGMISVAIGPAIDPGNTVVDAIEVYGIDRKYIDEFIPTCYWSEEERRCSLFQADLQTSSSVFEQELDTKLQASVTALSDLRDSSPESNITLSTKHRSLIQNILEVTLISRTEKLKHSTENLIPLLEPDESLRGYLYAEYLLLGAIQQLESAWSTLNGTREALHTNMEGWRSTYPVVKHCLEVVSNVARHRPMIYLQSSEKVSEKHLVSKLSFATISCEVVLAGLNQSVPCHDLIDIPGGVIEMILTEMILELNTDQGKHLGDFSTVRKFLESENSNVVRLTCKAICSFCLQQSPSQEGRDLFTLMQGTRQVAYQCDSCGLCPLTGVRYTLLEEENFDIDLCQTCHMLAQEFAKNCTNLNAAVEIKGRAIGSENELTCKQAMEMKSVPLEKRLLEQIGVSGDKKAENDGTGSTRTEEGDEVAESVLVQSRNSYDAFLSHIFQHTMKILKKEKSESRLPYMLNLLMFLIKGLGNKQLADAQARLFAAELTSRLSRSIALKEATVQVPGLMVETSMTRLFRALRLLLLREDSDLYEKQHDDPAKGKMINNPAVVCSVHNKPAVRRRSPRGVSKGRRFYVCGMERGKRCEFFQWADEVDGVPSDTPGSIFFKSIVRDCLWGQNHEIQGSLQAQLCGFLENVLLRDGHEESENSSKAACNEQAKAKPLASNESRQHQYETDLSDGVFCSRQKLSAINPTVRNEDLSGFERGIRSMTLACAEGDPITGVSFLDACLEVMALVADYRTKGIYRWFSLLCELEASTRPLKIRVAAKKCIKGLCGRRRALFQSVRNHFSFGIHSKRLYSSVSKILEEALFIGEKARICGQSWVPSKSDGVSELGLGGLVGADELISENHKPTSLCRQIEKHIDELWAMARVGGDSWRYFCGLRSLPQGSIAATSSRFMDRLLSLPPLLVLLLTAFSLNGSCQLKLFRLVNLALTEPSTSGTASNQSDADEIEKILRTQGESVQGRSMVDTPENIILKGESKLVLKDLLFFVVHFVLHGRRSELRRTAVQIASRLAHQQLPMDRENLLEKLLSTNFMQLGRFGKGATEFFQFLQQIAEAVSSEKHVGYLASIVEECFIDQMVVIKSGQWKFSSCRSCLTSRPMHLKKAGNEKKSERREVSLLARTMKQQPGKGSEADNRRIPRSEKKLHAEQIGAFYRSRLDTLKYSLASNEFCTFVSLKQRMVISDLHIHVSDPRGRFVKTLTVFSSPRPSGEASELKNGHYDDLWQACARITLPRGASRASCKFSHPFVAANLKIEYTGFYERPGGSKSSDGSLLVHCPRCTRVVTNAHGVCGNCGEVAFQCRKCRHINYDRLDAYLCVECGYCASGTFSFEFTAAGATNAIAICNDNDYNRAMKTIGCLVSLRDDLRLSISSKSHELSHAGEELHSLNSSLNHAVMGFAPVLDPSKLKQGFNVDLIEREGSIVRMVARPEATLQVRRSSASTDRTRSLLRLARQIRNESSSARGGRRSGNVIIRHLGRDLSADGILDEDTDMVGLLESGLDDAVVGANETQREPKMSQSKRSVDAEVERLSGLLKEADSELYEVQRRVDAWRMLNEGNLVDVGVEVCDEDAFESSQCSLCAGTVAFHLLTLWSQLFLAQPSEVDVDKEFVSLLLTETSSMGKSLSGMMRKTVKDVALNSKEGASLVLGELRKRLHASDDTISGEILGEIMAKEDFFMAKEYSELAVEVLSKR